MPSTLPLVVRDRIFRGLEPTLIATSHVDGGLSLICNPGMRVVPCSCVQSVRSMGIFIVASDLNIQIDHLAGAERHIGGRFSVPTDRTGKDERLT